MNHLKSLRTPKTWPIERKRNTFTTRPNPGPKKLEEAVSLNFLVRNMLQMAKTTRETKKALGEGRVAVNGVIRKDHKFPVGILDVVTIVPTKESYILTFSTSGKLQVQKLKTAVQGKLAKIIGKTVLKGKKLQLNLHDSTNILVDKDTYKTGDTLIIEDKKIKKHMKCEKGALVYLIGGKHKGKEGIVEHIQLMQNMQKHRIVVKEKKETFETLKEYAFVIEKSFTDAQRLP